MFMLRTVSGDEVIWDGSLAPGYAADALVAWATGQGSVAATPVGPVIETRTFPRNETDAYWVTVAWAHAQGDGITETVAPAQFDPSYGQPAGTVF